MQPVKVNNSIKNLSIDSKTQKIITNKPLQKPIKKPEGKKEEIDESKLRIPKKKNVLILIFLLIITLGIYVYIWFIERTSELNNLKTNTKASKAIPLLSFSLYILSLLVIITVGAYLSLTNNLPMITSIQEIPQLIQISAYVIISIIVIKILILLIAAFKVRTILNESLVNKGEIVKLSGFYTLIFNLFYLQYEINRITEDKENNKRIGPLVSFLLFVLLPLLALITWLIILSLNI